MSQSQSPSKRQRVSVDTFVSRGNGDTELAARSNPTTPTRRASYLSPTKASLARSHPKLLTKSPRRSATEPRRRLNNEIRREQDNATEDINEAQTSTQRDQNVTVSSREEQAAQDGSDLAAAIAQAFKDIPLVANGGHVEDQLPTQLDRVPLSPTQPRTRETNERTTYNGDQTEPILPKLVKQAQLPAQAQLRTTEDDVNLPPTPVQLGLSQAPYRPRGLASSSSGGSRSGTGKHRRRTRNDERGSITSSPLKPRRGAEATSLHVDNGAQSRGQEADEAPESDAEDLTQSTRTGISAEAQQKQTQLVELQAELVALQKEMEQLESLSQRLSVDEPLQLGAHLQTLLAGSGRNLDADPNSLDSHTAFLTDPKAFLKLFAPADLRLLHSSETKRVKKRSKLIHKLTITAPEPWLETALQLTFNVTIDCETASVESITQTKPGLFYKHDALQQWIENRLSSSLHKYDIAGLVLGAGQYFEACIARARVFQALSSRHTSQERATIAEGARLDAQSALTLSQYLEMNQLNLSIPPTLRRDSNNEVERRMMLTYDLSLTWTGSVQTTVHITCTDIGPKAQKSAKDLFQKLMTSEGVTEAFEGIWRLIELSDGNDDVFSKHQPQSRKARKKVVAH